MPESSSRSLVSAVRLQITNETDPPTIEFTRPTSHSSSRSSNDGMSSMARRVSSKLGEGDFRGAVRIACSDSRLAEVNDTTFEALKRKHPAVCPDSSFPPAPPQEDVDDIFAISEEMIICAIRSFPAGSAGGPDGLRPQHLKGNCRSLIPPVALTLPPLSPRPAAFKNIADHHWLVHR